MKAGVPSPCTRCPGYPPVIDNDQDMPRLAGRLPRSWSPAPPRSAMCCGATASMSGARSATPPWTGLEALEFLLATDIERSKLV